MNKKYDILFLILLVGAFIFYIFSTILKLDAVSFTLTPIIAIFATIGCLYPYITGNYFKINWLFTALFCASWALADSAWTTYYFLGFDPESVDLVDYLFILPNIFLVIAGFYFFFTHKSLRDNVQLGVDVITTLIVVLHFTWLMFFNHQLVGLWFLETIGLSGVFYLVTDLIVFSINFIIYISYRTRKKHILFTLISFDIMFYTWVDIIYTYQYFNHTYSPGGLIDIGYSLVITISGVCGLLSYRYKNTMAQPEVFSSNISMPRNIGSANKISVFLALPFVVIMIIEFDPTELFFMLAVVTFHQLATRYIEKSNFTRLLLTEQSRMNDILEQKVQNRTQELDTMNKQLQNLSNIDTLTNLFNRRSFMNRLDNFIAENSQGRNIHLMFMDLDRFKSINDKYGHDVGDAVLQEIGNRLEEFANDNVVIARLGGDEFIIACLDQCDKDEITKRIHCVIEKIEAPMRIGTLLLHTSASIGVTSYPDDADNRISLFKNADIAMYHAKENNLPYSFFSSSHNEMIQRRHDLEIAMKNADYDKEFFLVYQPQFNISTNRMTGVEALLRWNMPEEGLISPVEFIPLAEDTGIIIPLGMWVLKSAIRQISRWNKEYGKTLKMGINISSHQLKSADFVEDVIDLTRANQISPEYIDLEITESSAMIGEEYIEKIFADISSAGYSISIDDFGTGYSSLSHLKRFQVDRLKIAKPLIDTISFNFTDEQIVRAIVSMAGELGIRTIAEGVESQEQLEKLKELKCDEIQGYIYSKPLPAGDFEHIYFE